VSRSPETADVVVLFASVVGLWAVLRAVGGPPLFDAGAAMGFAAASVAMTGLPALAWALDRGRGSVRAMLMAGAIAGAFPPFIVLGSGILRLVVIVGADSTRVALADGAIIPGRGLLPWGWFLALIGKTVLVGLASGLIIWQVSRIRYRRRE
jgi:hypothetical protein